MIYYDFIRPHMGLVGLTPAEMAGLYEASGQNRWMELLRSAITNQDATPKQDT